MDDVARNMQNEIIRICEEQLGESIPDNVVNDIRLFQGYIGLEMIIDTVKTLKGQELREYLNKLRMGLG